jgi:hypothetical protein
VKACRYENYWFIRRRQYAILCLMKTIEDIEKAVSLLPTAELDKFRVWFETFDARRFDERIERDVRAGRLDGMADEALAEHRAGRTREL